MAARGRRAVVNYTTAPSRQLCYWTYMATGDDGTSQRGPEKTWEKSAPSQIILNSIFAALSAVLITLVIGGSLPPDLKYWENKFKFAELLLSFPFFFSLCLRRVRPMRMTKKMCANMYTIYCFTISA